MIGVRGATWDISGVSTPLICWVSCRESKFTWISAHQSHVRWRWVLEHMCWLKYVRTVGNSMVVVSPLISFMIDQTVSQGAAETTFIIAWHTEGSIDHRRQIIASINNTCTCMHTIRAWNDWAYQSCWHVGGHRAIMQTLIWPTWMKPRTCAHQCNPYTTKWLRVWAYNPQQKYSWESYFSTLCTSKFCQPNVVNYIVIAAQHKQFH